MRVPFPALLVACVVAGCSQSPSEGPSASTTAKGNEAGAVQSSKPKLKALAIDDVTVGKGDKFQGTDRPAAIGDTVFVLYTGKLANGTVFDSNAAQGGTAFSFTLGEGMVIAGWDKGVVGMKVGGERKLSIPSDLGYGQKAQEKIPAGSDLYFDIKLLALVKPKEDNIIDKYEVKVGSGPEMKSGSKVTVYYKVLNTRGDIVESNSYGKGVSFVVGAHEAVPSLEIGMAGMRQGGTRELRLAPSAAMFSPKMPGTGVQYVHIELLKVE